MSGNGSPKISGIQTHTHTRSTVFTLIVRMIQCNLREISILGIFIMYDNTATNDLYHETSHHRYTMGEEGASTEDQTSEGSYVVCKLYC